MNLIFDFDSTIIQSESLDELARIVLKNDKKKMEAFEEITNRGMRGELDFSQSLVRRIDSIAATRLDVSSLIQLLKSSVSPSIEYLKLILADTRENCYVVSGGFMDYIKPICRDLGFLDCNIFANQFVYNNESVIGFDRANILSNTKGKTNLIQSLNLLSPILMVGDGYTDLEVKLEGVADQFIAFTENVHRDRVVEKADYICTNFNQVYQYIHDQKF
jgi:D-3-phosphoglycerate dehydrogenase